MTEMNPYKVRFTATIEMNVWAEDWKDAVSSAKNKFSIQEGKCTHLRIHNVDLKKDEK